MAPAPVKKIRKKPAEKHLLTGEAALKKLARGKCMTAFCRKKRALNNTGYYLKLCWTCRSRKDRKRNPIAQLLRNLRVSASRRNISISLTLAEFTAWCLETEYHVKHGQDPNSLTVDRIDSAQGYHIWNIQVKSHKENSADGPVVHRQKSDEHTNTPDEGDPF